MSKRTFRNASFVAIVAATSLGLTACGSDESGGKSQKADPRTCTYDLTKAEGGYEVDSQGTDCNITYQRTSGKGRSYPFKASLVWDVTWTDTAGPDGPPMRDPALADSQSTFEQDVTVEEIQSIVRD
ncbi:MULTISPECIES: hypothetical protein [unclassified Streptomyces]|uniref:hypothetical protein n=1 Tax=unclassified Streptomyces TaxID=2593676 RepID=UPI002DDC68F8|nr:hypothetical protein [Streptomyces sp. NBC_01775]WSB75813.1 hypothetical protein OHB04_08430 [Streptomyces sp. NBC_01775]WSS44750.1 hypothetical protein OG220_32305 [Streptomyces sp. NBC_01187]